MPGEELKENTVTKLFDSGKIAQIEEFFSKWNFANANSSSFQMTEREKHVLGEKIAEKIEVDELTAILLETVRLIGRERQGLESLLNRDLCDKVLLCAGLTNTDGYPKTTHAFAALIEAQKCLVNTMFHSMKMRERFFANPDTTDRIVLFLTEFEESRRKKSQIQWIRDMNPTQAADVWFFYYRIVFIATAMSQDFQKKLTMKPDIVDTLFLAVEKIFVENKEIPPVDYQRAGEAMKSFFNTYCHFQKDVVEILDEEHALKACRLLRDVILSERVSDEIRQNAIHALSVPPVPMLCSVLCSDPTKPIPSTENRDLKNMVLTETVLSALDKQLVMAVAMLNSAPEGQVHQEGKTLVDLVGPYFQFLARLCVESKHVRRYCRLRVLPPLVAEEVKKRPEEHDTLRGRIVRVMMLPSSTKEVAAEFLFIICKRSVSRMIKYVGFGHSAGHIANMGLLGQINQPKHASDSEDSETEDYNSVKDNANSSVNPVTGAMYPPDHGSALAGMSDAQKEYEAMKLVDAMNKMMDQGLVKPGTIGEDGRLREVSHVLELVKNVPEEKESDSDSD